VLLDFMVLKPDATATGGWAWDGSTGADRFVGLKTPWYSIVA
jgi:hypothetical protein